MIAKLAKILDPEELLSFFAVTGFGAFAIFLIFSF
jgi:hypothetical protein